MCGSFEVRFSDGRPSRYFCWDDIPGRRLNPDLVDSEKALERAKALARAVRDNHLAAQTRILTQGRSFAFYRAANLQHPPKRTGHEA